MKNINIQWVTQDAGLFELDWLCEILNVQETDIKIVRHFQDFKTDKNSLVICNHAVNYRVCLDALRANSRQYSVFLLSDENLIETCEWLHDPNCLFSIRNYIHPVYFNHPKVMTIGLGYKRDFKKHLMHKLAEDRHNTWVFAGTPHNDRKNMLNTFERLKPNKTHSCSGFCANDALSTEGYAQMLNDSKFALCPPGQDSMDSFRLYEALEAGCIPVATARTSKLPVFPSYWHAVMRSAETYEIPFVIEDEWKQCLNKVTHIVQSTEYNKKQRQCQLFWKITKQNWVNKIKKKVNLLAQNY
jgi:hypothetical protein